MTNYLLAHQVFNYLNYNREDNNIHLIYPRPCACMTEGKGREENCPLNRELRNDSYGSSCLIQESGTAVSRYNRERAECFFGMILCHEKAYSALNEELLEKDSTDINFKLVGSRNLICRPTALPCRAVFLDESKGQNETKIQLFTFSSGVLHDL